MKKLVLLFTALGLCFALVGCGSKDDGEMISLDDKKEEETPADLLSGKYIVEIDMKDYGKITVELDADIAPITVTNYVSLVKDGFYDGLTLHRIIKDFMIQGGDPKGDGSGGSDKNIKGEFKNNGVENNLSHKRGVISMARSNANDSASSQFFIMHQDNTSLDGNYAAFGHVTSGMEVVDKIAEKVKPVDDNGTVNKENQPVITSIKIVE